MNSVYVLEKQKMLKLGEGEDRYSDVTESRVKLSNPNQFYRSLAFLYKSGHPISHSFKLLAAGMPSQKERLACLKVYAHIRNGRNLSQSFAASGFPLPLAAAVKAGENSGRLDEALAWYADFEERNQEIIKQLKQALFYPSIILTFALLLAFVMPPLVLKEQLSIMASSGTELPLISQALLQFSKIVSHPVFLLIFPLAWFGVLMARATLQLQSSRRKFEAFLLSLPMIGPGLRRASATRSLALMGLLLRSGVSLTKTLEVAGEGSGSLLLRERLERASLALQEGKTFLDCLERANWYLPSTINLVAASEITGDLASLMGLATEIEEDSFRDRLRRFSVALQPALLFIVGILVCLTIMAVLGPSLALIQGI